MISQLSDIPLSELDWLIDSVIGMSIIMRGGTIDSNGNEIKPFSYYKVAKQHSTGKIIIELYIINE